MILIGQLIDYNMRNSFVQKSYTKCAAETSPRPFLKIANLVYLWTNQLKFQTVYFYCLPSSGLSKYIETSLHATCINLIRSFLKKRKQVWDQSPYLIFCIMFKEKYFCSYALLIDQVSLSNCFYFARYCAIYVL